MQVNDKTMPAKREGHLWQVMAPHFTAGLICNDNGVVIVAAPIIKWSIGKSIDYLRNYADGKGWFMMEVG